MRMGDKARMHASLHHRRGIRWVPQILKYILCRQFLCCSGVGNSIDWFENDGSIYFLYHESRSGFIGWRLPQSIHHFLLNMRMQTVFDIQIQIEIFGLACVSSRAAWPESWNNNFEEWTSGMKNPRTLDYLAEWSLIPTSDPFGSSPPQHTYIV